MNVQQSLIEHSNKEKCWNWTFTNRDLDVHSGTICALECPNQTTWTFSARISYTFEPSQRTPWALTEEEKMRLNVHKHSSECSLSSIGDILNVHTSKLECSSNTKSSRLDVHRGRSERSLGKKAHKWTFTNTLLNVHFVKRCAYERSTVSHWTFILWEDVLMNVQPYCIERPLVRNTRIWMMK